MASCDATAAWRRTRASPRTSPARAVGTRAVDVDHGVAFAHERSQRPFGLRLLARRHLVHASEVRQNELAERLLLTRRPGVCGLAAPFLEREQADALPLMWSDSARAVEDYARVAVVVARERDHHPLLRPLSVVYQLLHGASLSESPVARWR